MAAYDLPDLPYDYGALAPHISGQIMELHHSKHHATYVKGVNTALEKMEAARDSNSFDTIAGLEKNLAFNLGGHINHSVFWPNLSPDGGDKPDGELGVGDRRVLRQLRQVPRPLRGQRQRDPRLRAGRCWSGTPSGSRLNIVQLYDQQANLPLAQLPILILDMWEHAFYLDYKNVKADYVKAWWNVANWRDAQARFAAAKSQTAGLIAPY